MDTEGPGTPRAAEAKNVAETLKKGVFLMF